MVPVHGDITRNALIGFPTLSDPEKRRIVEGSMDADLVEGALPVIGGPYDKRFHFDNNFTYQAVMDNFVAISILLDRNIAAKSRDHWEFGKLLHAIEDFYSHSNYVLLYRDYVAQNGNEMVGAIPSLEHVMTRPKEFKRFIELLKKELRTGRYPTPSLRLASDTDHGPPAPSLFSGGMNKDWLGRTFFVDARETAGRSATWYLSLYTKDPKARKDWVALKAAFALGAR